MAKLKGRADNSTIKKVKAYFLKIKKAKDANTKIDSTDLLGRGDNS